MIVSSAFWPAKCGADFWKIVKPLLRQAVHNQIPFRYVVNDVCTSDLDLTYDQITTLYGKRWSVEPDHKSLKQNATLSLSPTKTVTTQSNHLSASLCAYIKLEMLKVSTHTNHFALKSKLYVRALRAAFDALSGLQPIRLAA